MAQPGFHQAQGSTASVADEARGSVTGTRLGQGTREDLPAGRDPGLGAGGGELVGEVADGGLDLAGEGVADEEGVVGGAPGGGVGHEEDLLEVGHAAAELAEAVGGEGNGEGGVVEGGCAGGGVR